MDADVVAGTDRGHPIVEKVRKDRREDVDQIGPSGLAFQDLARPLFGQLDVGLIEGMNPEDHTGHCGGDLRRHHLCCQMCPICNRASDRRGVGIRNLDLFPLQRIDQECPIVAVPIERRFVGDRDDAFVVFAEAFGHQLFEPPG